MKPAKPVEIITDPEEIKEVENRARIFLSEVFASMNLGEVEITSKYNTTDGSLEVDFEGEDMGILIGKRGQTLDSLQYLVSLIVNKETDGYLRVKLDTENYRERRKETLETLAKNIAYKVKRTKRPVSLEPMNPYERRIIHAAIQNDKYVTTRSEGEEPFRHVVIALKKETAPVSAGDVMTAAAAGAMSVPAATGEIPAGMTPIRRLPCQSIMLRQRRQRTGNRGVIR